MQGKYYSISVALISPRSAAGETVSIAGSAPLSVRGCLVIKTVTCVPMRCNMRLSVNGLKQFRKLFPTTDLAITKSVYGRDCSAVTDYDITLLHPQRKQQACLVPEFSD